MLLQLIAVPAVVLVTVGHALLHAYAPSNVLIRRVRGSRPTLRMAVVVGALAVGCAFLVLTLHLAVEAGASGWLNVVVLLLAWDAIKFAVTACATSARCVASASLKGACTLTVSRPYQ